MKEREYFDIKKGDKYDDQLKKDLKEGKVTMFYSGDKYEWQWKNGLLYDKGKFYFDSRRKYEGYYIEG